MTRPDPKSDINNMQERPSIADMFVSVSRVKPYTGTMRNAQISVKNLLPQQSKPIKPPELSFLAFEDLKTCIAEDLTDLGISEGEDDIECDGKIMSLVWLMSESGQLGRVYDDDSFQCAVEDHRLAYKNIVQLYIIDSKGE